MSEEIPWPKCIHRWDAPETCPLCLALYNQRVIDVRDAEIAALRKLIREARSVLVTLSPDWETAQECDGEEWDVAETIRALGEGGVS